MSKEPTIESYLGIEEFEDKCDADLHNRLSKLHAEIDNLSSLDTEDPDDVQTAIDDIQWYSSELSDAVAIIEHYTEIYYLIDHWRSEVESRLSDEEKEEFEQLVLVHRLKTKPCKNK